MYTYILESVYAYKMPKNDICIFLSNYVYILIYVCMHVLIIKYMVLHCA